MVNKIFTRIVIASCITLSGGIATVAALAGSGAIHLTNENKRYKCNFYNYDGAFLYSCLVEPSHTAVYRGRTPVRPADEDYSYQFTGWDHELTTITHDTKFTAEFDAKRRDYCVTFINYDSTLLYTTYVPRFLPMRAHIRTDMGLIGNLEL